MMIACKRCFSICFCSCTPKPLAAMNVFVFTGLMGEGTRLETRVQTTTCTLVSWMLPSKSCYLEMSKVRDMGEM